MKHRFIRALTVIGAAFVLMIGGAIAYAQIPSADGSITACMTKPAGTIRIIDTGAEANCKKAETKLTWPSGATPFPAQYAGTNFVTVIDTDQSSVREVACDVGDRVAYGNARWRIPAGTHTQSLTWAEGPAVIGPAEGWYAEISTDPPDTVLPMNVAVTCLDTAAPFHTG